MTHATDRDSMGVNVSVIELDNFDRVRNRLEQALESMCKSQTDEPNWYPGTWTLVFVIRDLIKDDNDS